MIKERKFCCGDMADYWGNIVDTEEESVGIVQGFRFMPINFCPWCAARVGIREQEFVVIERPNTTKCSVCRLMGFLESEVCVSCIEKINYKQTKVAKYNSIQQKVKQSITSSRKQASKVVYYAFVEDKEGLPIDNLEDIAIQGQVHFYCDRLPFQKGNKKYSSKVVTNPTWLEVAVLADEMMQKLSSSKLDNRVFYLETIKITGEDNGVKAATFVGEYHKNRELYLENL